MSYSRPAGGGAGSWNGGAKDGANIADHHAFVAQQLAQVQGMIINSHERTLVAASQRKDAELQRLQQENRELRAELGRPPGEEVEPQPQSTSFFSEASNISLLAVNRPPEPAAAESTEHTGLPGIVDIDCDEDLSAEKRGSNKSVASFASFHSRIPSQRQPDEWGSPELLEVWAPVHAATQRLSRSSTKQVQDISHSAICAEFNYTTEEQQHHQLMRGHLKHLVVHPTSRGHLTWDGMSLFLVFFDLIYVPFNLFDPEPSIFDDVASWVSRLFWTVDIFVSFVSGYHGSDGFTEMRLGYIARRYLRTWCLLDLLVVGCSWFELAWQEGGAEYTRLGKASRSLRILRMLRLLRMFRLWHTFARMAERLQDEKLSIMMHVGKIVICIMGWSHLTACIWYGIGTSVAEGDPSWVYKHELTDTALAYRYFISLHWSLSQFAGGMDEFTPENTVERAFVILAFILAFLLASAFTSILTSSITRLHLLTSGQSQSLAMLRRFLSQNSISNALGMRVQRNAQLAINSRHIPEQSVELFKLVSSPLKVELHYELFSSTLLQHPFFYRYNQDYPHIVQQICHSACVNSQFAWGDTLFSVGESPLHPKMYFVRSGTLEYVQTSGCADTVTAGMWLAEPVLWVTWKHRGMLRASGECVVLELDAKILQGIVKRFDHPTFSPWHYATKFHEALLTTDESPLDLIYNLDVAHLVEEAADRFSATGLNTRTGEESDRAERMSPDFVGVTPATNVACADAKMHGPRLAFV